jgi:hypothetical protein
LKKFTVGSPFFFRPPWTNGRLALHYQLQTGVTFGIAVENLAIIATTGFLRPVRVDPEHARQTD